MFAFEVVINISINTLEKHVCQVWFALQQNIASATNKL